MSDYTKLMKYEEELLESLVKGKDPIKHIRSFATKAYQDGFKAGILDTSNSWWKEMDGDQAYIDSIAERDAADNAKEWDAI